MLNFQNVSKFYQPNIQALKDVSFQVNSGEFVSIVGRSGAGKTTLLKLVLAEETPSKGKIFFENQDIHSLDSKDLPMIRRKIGAVFQDYKLLLSKNCFENISYAMEVVGASEQEIKTDVKEVLDIVDLTERAYNFPAELSGGEKQRVAIARALILRPELILADEPTGNLDPYCSLDIVRLLSKINRMGTTVVLATHHKDIVDKVGKRVISLEDGEVIRDQEKGAFVI